MRNGWLLGIALIAGCGSDKPNVGLDMAGAPDLASGSGPDLAAVAPDMTTPADLAPIPLDDLARVQRDMALPVLINFPSTGVMLTPNSLLGGPPATKNLESVVFY